MIYGILNPKKVRKRIIHLGILKFSSSDYFKINLKITHDNDSTEFKKINREIFFGILKVLNKYYDLEDLNKRIKNPRLRTTGNTKRIIKKGEINQKVM